MSRAEMVPRDPRAPVVGCGRGGWTGALCFALALAPFAWTASDSVLVAEWTGGETGRTVYRLLGAAGVEVVDSVRTAGGWREFGRARYRR